MTLWGGRHQDAKNLHDVNDQDLQVGSQVLDGPKGAVEYVL